MTGIEKKRVKNKIGMILLQFIFLISQASFAYAYIDRVVAFADDRAITLSEFEEQYRKTKEVSPDIRPDEVLNTMVNRILLLRDAKKYRIEGASDSETIKEYIDLRVRAFITIGESEVEAFYRQNLDRFSGKDFEQARTEIEEYLIEKELNRRLEALIAELRKKAYIKLQL